MDENDAENKKENPDVKHLFTQDLVQDEGDAEDVDLPRSIYRKMLTLFLGAKR